MRDGKRARRVERVPKARSKSGATILRRLAQIEDPMTIYLLEMLIDRVADLASGKAGAERGSAGLSLTAAVARPR